MTRARLLAALRELRRTEPALLKARYAAIAGVLLAAGITIPGVVDRWVGVGLALFAFVSPWLQGRRTRVDVWSQQTVGELTDLVAQYPELAQVAKEMLGRGMSIDIIRKWLERPVGDHRAPVA